MDKLKLKLALWKEPLAIVGLPPGGPLPPWACQGTLWQASHSPTETTLVCEENAVPSEVKAQRSWRALEIQNTSELSVPGILSSVLEPLARAGLGIFAFSTFTTDWVLVPSAKLEEARKALREAGHSV